MNKRDKAPVDVVMPEIKLTIADLAYMTGLLPGATRCTGDSKVTDKLKFLGLIEIQDVPACPKAVAAFDASVKEWQTKTVLAVKEKRWEDVGGMSYALKEDRRPAGSQKLMLTATGAEFIAKGRTRSITSLKASCL